MNKKQRYAPVVAVTMGDPAGIGPEIVLKACISPDITKSYRLMIVGSTSIFNYYKKRLNMDVELVPCSIDDDLFCAPNRLAILPINSSDVIIEGRPSRGSGLMSGLCIKEALKLALEKKVDAITTAPVSKIALRLGGFNYPGHTEMLADYTNTKEFAMMLSGGGIRVVLATTHMAISRVNGVLSRERIEGLINTIYSCFPLLGIDSPKIGVCALNPHAGEEGLFGDEEREIIKPAISSSQDKGIDVEGPYPADTIFIDKIRKRYDVILTMYHDQGLIPLKMKAFGKAVNITLGLPIIRTSCDHGTAYDIAGQNKASPDSIKEAIYMAAEMVINKLCL